VALGGFVYEVRYQGITRTINRANNVFSNLKYRILNGLFVEVREQRFGSSSVSSGVMGKWRESKTLVPSVA